MKVQWLYFALFLLLVALAGCGDGRTSDELRRVAEVVDDNPELALARLDSVELSALNSADRHYFDFLSIKAADKAYILHQSDSLIRSVIDYYEDRHDDELLPEVLYYGGRVYHDLGDAPLALEYYQKSLDIKTNSKDALNLRGCIVSNMAQLMRSVYLYDQAIEKFKEAADIDKTLGQTYNQFYDTEQIATTFLNKDEVDSALYYYRQALEIAGQLSSTEITTAQLLIINITREDANYNEILRFIHPIISNYKDPNRELALNIGAWAYRKAGRKDSSIHCAKELIKYNSLNTRFNGYSSLLTSYGEKHNDTETLYKALREYGNLLDTINIRKSSEATIYQNSYYNYSIREKQNAELIEAKRTREFMIFAIVLVCIILLLYFRNVINSHKQQYLQLSLSLSRLNQLDVSVGQTGAVPESKTDLRTQLIDKINQRINSVDTRNLPKMLLESQIYVDFQKIASDNINVPGKKRWESFISLFEELFPQFRSNLTIILGTVSELDYQVCILTKCGFTPTQIGNLTAKTKGGISSCRMRMSERAFGHKQSVIYWDKFVKSL